uniref:Secreted protein n=1 Tax=Anopheles darlingi TaxID=43151 RepID=A0A2M4DAA0_ANODA
MFPFFFALHLHLSALLSICPTALLPIALYFIPPKVCCTTFDFRKWFSLRFLSVCLCLYRGTRGLHLF